MDEPEPHPPPSGRGHDDADAAALLAAVPHDVRAFEAVYRRYVRRVTGFAVSRCATAEDVADVVAQTFVRLLGAAARYDPALGDPAAFVLGIARNVVRDVQRRASRDERLVGRLAGRDLLDADDIGRLEAAIDAERAAPTLWQAVDAVPAGERAVLRLVADGHTPSQAAGELGITPGAARTRLARARRRARDHLTATTDPEPPR
jgi:RNA polymerase sigma factor (sigma-70 family)